MCIEFYIFWGQVRAMFRLYGDHDAPIFTSRPARVLKFFRMSQQYLQDVYGVSTFGTISRPCLDHVWIMFGLALIPDQLELQIVKTELTWSKKCVYEVPTF